MEDNFLSLLARLDGAGLDHYFDSAAKTAQYVGRLDRAFGPESLEGLGFEVAALSRRMEQGARRLGDSKAHDLELLSTALHGLDPEAPLERGYSLVRIERTGEFLRDPKGVTPGDALDIDRKSVV